MLGLGLALLQPLPFIGQHFMGLGLLGQNGSTSIDSSELLPELAVQVTFTLPASSYATMAIRELTKASTSVFPISQIIYLVLIQQNLFCFASATFYSLLETCKRPCRRNFF
jgi:hypothetical protein